MGVSKSLIELVCHAHNINCTHIIFISIENSKVLWYVHYHFQQRSALSYSKSAESTPNRFNIGISTNSLGGSSRSTTKTSMSNIYRPDGYITKNNASVSTAASTTTPSNRVDHDYAPSYYKPSKCTNLDGKWSSLPKNLDTKFTLLKILRSTLYLTQNCWLQLVKIWLNIYGVLWIVD